MSNLEVRRELGKSHLNANRIKLALEIFSGILQEFPGDVESHIILGDCYLAGNDPDSALALYQKAEQLAPENLEVQQRIELAHGERPPDPPPHDERANPTDRSALGELLQTLTGRENPVTEDDIERAAFLLEEIVNSTHPAELVAEHLDEINQLIPALLELNVQQALAEGQHDLADSLDRLRQEIQAQMADEPSASILTNSPTQSGAIIQRDLSITLRVGILSRTNGLSMRHEFIQRVLTADQEHMLVENCFDQTLASDGQSFDIILAFTPHALPGAMEKIAAFTTQGVQIIIDLEQDFENMPLNHPDYPRLGLDSSARSKAYAASLSLADCITVPSELLAAQIRTNDHKIHVIPPGWDRGNELWNKSSPIRQSLNIGWLGDKGNIEDIASIRRSVVRVMREFQHTQLVIGGDPAIYQLFESIPEYRRIFLPEVEHEDYPSLLAQMDILLIPKRNTAFNRTLSDRLLLEAGIRKIPWIATPLPAYKNWKLGGLFAGDREEWYTQLRSLITDDTQRQNLATQGRLMAETRELKSHVRRWINLFDELLKQAAAEKSGLNSENRVRFQE